MSVEPFAITPEIRGMVLDIRQAFTPEIRGALLDLGRTMQDISHRVVDALKIVADVTVQKAMDGDIETIEFLQSAGLYVNSVGELEELDPDERCNSVVHSRTHPDD